MVSLLAPDVVFRSPVVFRQYDGRDAVGVVLRAVLEVFEDFRYTDELSGPSLHGLVFRARVGNRELEGIDLLRTTEDGTIADFTVMVRPLSAALALRDAMAEKLAAQTSAT